MDETSLISRLVEAVGQGDLDAALGLFHEESWDVKNRVYGKQAIHRYLQEFLQGMGPQAKVCRGRLGNRPVAYVEVPGRLGGMARRGFWWIELRDGLIGELHWEENSARASLVVST